MIWMAFLSVLLGALWAYETTMLVMFSGVEGAFSAVCQTHPGKEVSL
jgi:hypothetical protein